MRPKTPHTAPTSTSLHPPSPPNINTSSLKDWTPMLKSSSMASASSQLITCSAGMKWRSSSIELMNWWSISLPAPSMICNRNNSLRKHTVSASLRIIPSPGRQHTNTDGTGDHVSYQWASGSRYSLSPIMTLGSITCDSPIAK